MYAEQLKLALHKLTCRLVTGPAQVAPRQQKKLCIYKCDGIGDFVLAISAIRLLIREFGEENTLLVTLPLQAQLAAAVFPNLDRITIQAIHPKYRFRRLRAMRKQRRILGGYRFEKLISLCHQRNEGHDAELSWIQARESYGFVDRDFFKKPSPYQSCPFRFSRPVTRSIEANANKDDSLCEELRMHRAILDEVLGRATGTDEIRPVLEVAQSPDENMAVIAALPGQSHSGPLTKSLREIPEGLLAAAIRHLRARGIERICLTGGANQREVLASQAGSLAAAGIQAEVIMPHSIAELLHLVSRARLIFSAETGTAHMAVALDKPTVTLIGGGHYGQFGPWSRSARQEWVRHRVPCYGCNWCCNQSEPICITQITPEAVTTAIDRVLAIENS